jgi:hypothetical protein
VAIYLFRDKCLTVRTMRATQGLECLVRAFTARFFLALSIVSAQAQAAPLTLGCSGIVTSRQVSKHGIPGEPEKKDVVGMSIVVDFDQRTLAGFWTEEDGVHNALPITEFDANSVNFHGAKGNKDSILFFIDGTVDRITGKVDANETWYWRSGGQSFVVWDLQCKPTKPLF